MKFNLAWIRVIDIKLDEANESILKLEENAWVLGSFRRTPKRSVLWTGVSVLKPQSWSWICLNFSLFRVKCTIRNKEVSVLWRIRKERFGCNFMPSFDYYLISSPFFELLQRWISFFRWITNFIAEERFRPFYIMLTPTQCSTFPSKCSSYKTKATKNAEIMLITSSCTCLFYAPINVKPEGGGVGLDFDRERCPQGSLRGRRRYWSL